MVLDLTHQTAKDIVLQLAAQADVFVQNFRPGAIERLGLGQEAMRAARPDIVYVSINDFGEEGPYAGLTRTVALTNNTSIKCEVVAILDNASINNDLANIDTGN